ncbi:MAG TPA: hypothetical protein VFA83_11045 [Acidimicrobiales bacterium]|nr:hypothetical protein [Acidimicrobiales bacterium]
MSDALEVVTAPDPVHHPTRVHELRSAVGSLRVRAGRGGVDRYLFIAACVLVPLGLSLVLLGWYGSAHTPYQFEQLPYVISGGLLGTALAVLGGLAYFAHWMTRVVNDQRAQTERIVSALENLASSSNGAGVGAGAPAAAAAATATRSSRARANGGGSFVATPTGTMFHRPDCVVVANRPKVRKVSADAKGFEACKLCDPLGEG